MAVSKSAANAGRKTHGSTPSSKLSKQDHVVKPESRIGAAPHNRTVAQAEKLISGLGGGK